MEPDGFDRVAGFVGTWRFAVTMISLLVFAMCDARLMAAAAPAAA